jgi:preprotein translocase subunit SecG
MINFLVALDIILAILIVAGIFFHQGSDGFVGEAPSAIPTNFRFETYDKIIGSFALAFFLVTLSINYLTLYNHKGTADIDTIIKKVDLEKQNKKADTKKSDIDIKESDAKTEAPLAQ